MQREVVVVGAVRTAIGDFGGSLKDFAPTELGAMMVREVLARSSVEGEEVQHVVFGHVIQTEPQDMYLARGAALKGGVTPAAPAMTLNRLCGSGLQAIISAAQGILLGDANIAIAGGAESMSRAPYLSVASRFGQRMGDINLIDTMVGALTDPFASIHMGVTAENVAQRYGITRASQDALALESHRRASKAIQGGRFADQILPLVARVKRSEVEFRHDEHVRMDAKIEDFARLKPVFAFHDGTVTAGNASEINDGAAAVMLMESNLAKHRKSVILG
jgi:acetyl-CoA C-acetyltransferase